MSKIQEAIQQMSVEEMQQRLAEYMAADKEWAPKPIAIEVRHRDIKDISGTNIYDVIVVKDDNTEEVIKFEDRYSKLIYIYTLLHPKGYQRRSLNKPEPKVSGTRQPLSGRLHGRPRTTDIVCYQGLQPHDEHGSFVHPKSHRQDDRLRGTDHRQPSSVLRPHRHTCCIQRAESHH